MYYDDWNYINKEDFEFDKTQYEDRRYNILIIHGIDRKNVDFKSLFYYMENIATNLGIKLNTAHATSKNYDTKGKIRGFRAIKKNLEKHEFEDIENFSMSDYIIDYDSSANNFSVDLGIYLHQEDEYSCWKNNYLSFEIDEKFISYNELINVTRDISKFINFKVGYIVNLHRCENPQLYLYGKYHGPDRRELFQAYLWRERDLKKSKFLKYDMIRAVYEVNFLNEDHINRIVSDNLSFENWVTKGNRGELEKLSNKIWVWKVNKDDIVRVSEELYKSWMIVTIQSEEEMEMVKNTPPPSEENIDDRKRVYNLHLVNNNLPTD